MVERTGDIRFRTPWLPWRRYRLALGEGVFGLTLRKKNASELILGRGRHRMVFNGHLPPDKQKILDVVERFAIALQEMQLNLYNLPGVEVNDQVTSDGVLGTRILRRVYFPWQTAQMKMQILRRTSQTLDEIIAELDSLGVERAEGSLRPANGSIWLRSIFNFAPFVSAPSYSQFNPRAFAAYLSHASAKTMWRTFALATAMIALLNAGEIRASIEDARDRIAQAEDMIRTTGVGIRTVEPLGPNNMTLQIITLADMRHELEGLLAVDRRTAEILARIEAIQREIAELEASVPPELQISQ